MNNRAPIPGFVWPSAASLAERARRELQATGETVRKRTVDMREALTVQEARVAHTPSRTPGGRILDDGFNQLQRPGLLASPGGENH
jgi:hypothetical protein